jgi:nitroreductase
MDALEAIHTRRSIRKYEKKPLPDELLQPVLAAAMTAPSARNAQPWQFVVIDDRCPWRTLS